MRGYGGLLSTSSLGFRLGTTLVLALLPLGVLSIAQTQAQLDRMNEATLSGIDGASLEAVAPQIDLIRHAQTAAQTLAATLAGGIPDHAACVQTMQSVAASISQATLVAYIPMSGRMTCGSTGSLHDFSASPLFAQMTASPQPSVVYNPQGPVSGVAVIGLGHPVLDAAGQQVGVVSISLPYQSVAPQSYSDDYVQWQPALLATFTEDGTLLGTSADRADLAPFLPATVQLQALATRVGDPFFIDGPDGRSRIVSVTHLADRLFLLGVWQRDGAPGSAMLAPFVLPALTWAAALIVAAFASGRLVVRHVRALWRSMTSYMETRQLAPVPAIDEAPHEIRKLHAVYQSLITAIEQDEAELENLLVDKDVLLKEVHHRSGNSLQIIASVMRMYRRESRDPGVRAMLDGLIARVIALSSTHTSLYSLSGRRDVPLQDVLTGVIARMRDIHGIAPALTRTRLDPIAVAAPLAVPLAMALAEALGSLYAAPDLAAKGVDLDLRADGDEARLTIHGPVTPEFDPAVTDGLAALPRRMLLQFAAQVRGRVTTQVQDGLSVVDLTFPLTPV